MKNKLESPPPTTLKNEVNLPVKTRKQIYTEYGIGDKTFARKLKYHNIELPPGVITPKYQKLIYEALGEPPYKIQ